MTGWSCLEAPTVERNKVAAIALRLQKSGFSKAIAFHEVPRYMKCVAEVPYQVPPLSLPDAPRMPKSKSKEAYLVPASKARRYCKVLAVKCFSGCALVLCQGQPHVPSEIVKDVPGTRWGDTFE